MVMGRKEVKGYMGRHVEEEKTKVCLCWEDVLCGSKWSVGINQNAIRLR